MGRVRMIATDLDGTIVRSDGSISARTVEALTTLAAIGVAVVFATGRPPRWLHPVVDATGITGPVVCQNGAQVYDTATGTVLIEHVLEPPASLDIARDVKATYRHASFAAEIGTGFALEAAFSPGWDPPENARVADVEQILATPVVKLMARCPGTEPDELLATVRELVGSRASVTRSIGISLVEMSRPGVDKSTALAEIAAGGGFGPSEVVAFGDQSNDAGMLAWAGRGVAVANAHPHARQAASEVTGSVEEDGVAAVCEEIIATLGDI